MKRFLIISIVVIFAVVFSAPVFVEAQNGPARRDFATVKARILERMNKNISCVQSAQNFQDLEKCRPQRPPQKQGQMR